MIEVTGVTLNKEHEGGMGSSSVFMNQDHPDPSSPMGWVVIKETKAYVAYSAKVAYRVT